MTDALEELLQEEATPGGQAMDDLLAAPDGEVALATNGPGFSQPAFDPVALLIQALKARQDLRFGTVRGAASVGNTLLNAADVPLEYLQNKLGVTAEGTGAIPGIPNRAERDAALDFDPTNGSLAGVIGRVGGEVMMTAPLIAEGGGAIAASRLGQIAAPTIDAIRKAGVLQRAGVNALTGAAQGTVGATAISGGYEAPADDQAKLGALFGAALGGGGTAAFALGRGLRQLVGQGKVDPNVADLAYRAVTKWDLPIGGDQLSGDFVKRASAMSGSLPLSGAAAREAKMAGKFNQALSKTIGADADQFTPQVVQAARDKIGAKFDHVAQNVPPLASPTLGNTLAALERDAALAVTEQELAPIQRSIQSIYDKMANGGLTGIQYRALTKHGAPLSRGIESDNSNISYYASRVKEALDDALEAKAPANLKNLLKEAKYEWKNWVTLRPLIAKADAAGHVSPQLLRQRVISVWGDDAVARGQAGDLDELARIGQQFLKKPSSSGTAENLRAGAAGGIAAWFGLHNPVATGAVTAGVLGANRLLSSGLRSEAYRNMLLQPTRLAGTEMLPPGIIPGAISAGRTMQALPAPFVQEAR